MVVVVVVCSSSSSSSSSSSATSNGYVGRNQQSLPEVAPACPLVTFFEYLEKIMLYCYKKNNN